MLIAAPQRANAAITWVRTHESKIFRKAFTASLSEDWWSASIIGTGARFEAFVVRDRLMADSAKVENEIRERERAWRSDDEGRNIWREVLAVFFQTLVRPLHKA